MRSLSPASLLPLGCLLLILGVMAASAEPEPEPRRNRGRKNDDIWQVEDEDEAEQPKEDRDGKLLNIFQVVRFPNSACNTTTNDQGVCFTAKECTARGGSNAGTCASGFGVCCSFSIGCGGTTSQNNTYFVSSDTDTSPCSATVCMCQDDICQHRLDFDTFSIAGPIDEVVMDDNQPISRTACQNAQFTATSDGSTVPVLCGINSGYHMYLEADAECNTLSFSWLVAAPREWRIKVSQIRCGDRNKPPEGCLQWFTGATGVIESWNFNGGLHLGNQNYVSCIRAEQGLCTIEYSHAAMEFGVSGAMDLTIANDPTLGFGDECSTDYVYIPGVKIGAADMNADRFCGDALIQPLDTPVAGNLLTQQLPFQVGFISDGGEFDDVIAMITTNVDNEARGYRISYMQTNDCAFVN